MALVRIQVRRDTAADWSAVDPVLAEGEPGVETDTGNLKLGDGIRSWRNLPYSSGASPATTSPLDVGNRSSGTSLLYARADHSHALPSAVSVVSLTAGSATIAGNLSVTGSLIGGTHSHTVANISDWSTKSSDAVWANLAEGNNVTLSRNPETGVVTISAADSTGGDVTSVAGRTGAVVLSTADLSNFPTIASNNGKFLKTDGTVLEWADPYAGGGVSTVNALSGPVSLVAGSNITVTTNPSTGEVTLASTASAGTGDVTSVNSLIGALTVAAAAGSGLSVASSGSTITLDASISYADLTNVPSDFTPAAHTHTSADVTDLVEFIGDTIDSTLVAGTNVTLVYDDAAGSLTISAAGASAPTLLEGNAIAIDTSVPGEAEIAVDGTLDGGAYGGYVPESDPEYFSIQPQDQLVTFGTAIFTARVENADSPTYQWQKADAGSSDFLSLSDVSPYSGATTTTLSISPVGESDHGDKFRLLVSLADGSQIASREALLSTSAIQIYDQPASGDFVEADVIDVSAFLLVTVDGGTPPYAYQWQRWDGSAWADVGGETEYYVDTISGLLGASESQRVERWRVVITDSAGFSEHSDEGRLTIRAGAPEIVLDPTDQTISGGSATFTARHDGKGASVSWERREPDGGEFEAIGQSGVLTSPSPGITQSSLTVSGANGNDNGAEYRMRVSNDAGTAVSASATLNTGGPTISTQPESTTVVENAGATFTVVANFSNGSMTYQWQESTDGGFTWGTLTGATSSTLTLLPSNTTLGRDGSDFRVIVTGSGVDTYSKPARLTVISAPAAGDALFTINPESASLSDGASYSLTAVSTWLDTTDHYASVRVDYGNGDIEYHPLSTGEPWNGTATSLHRASQHASYFASLRLSKSAWVSVVISSSDPTAKTGAAGTYTMQPWAQPLYRNCVPESNPANPRAGVVQYPVSLFVLPQCAGSVTLNVPDPPYTYVESERARVTIIPRQKFIAPVPGTGFYNPPTSYLFEGAASIDSDSVVAAGSDSAFVSYMYSANEGKSWQTRFFPYPLKPHKVIYAWGDFYVFHDGSAVVSTDQGVSFQPTGWNFGGTPLRVSFAGGKLFASMPDGNTWIKSQGQAWTRKSVPLGKAAVGYAHSRYYCGLLTSLDGEDWGPVSGVAAEAYADWMHRWYRTDSPGPPTSDLLRDVTYHQVTLADPTQSYTLASTGSVAPISGATGGTAFGPITNGQVGSGPQIGDYIYFGDVRGYPGTPLYLGRVYPGGYATPTYGAKFFRKGTANPAVNESLISHVSYNAVRTDAYGRNGRVENSGYWSGKQNGAWSDVQIMSYQFGEPFGPNLDTTLYGTLNHPEIPSGIFTQRKLLHLFRYRATDDNAGWSPPQGGVIPSPRN